MTASSTTDRMTSHGAPDAGTREINIAHSPDSDDAFMFYGLATNKVRVPGLRFTHTLCDIETLNRKAQEGVYDVTAISFTRSHTSRITTPCSPAAAASAMDTGR